MHNVVLAAEWWVDEQINEKAVKVFVFLLCIFSQTNNFQKVAVLQLLLATPDRYSNLWTSTEIERT